MRDNSKIIKRVVTIVVTVLMVSIIIGSLCFILYTNRLLPQGFLEYIDAVKNGTLGKEQKIDALEKPLYETVYELDMPEYKKVDIIDLNNIDTMIFGTFSEKVINKMSIIVADGKYGLISNEDGKILLEPKYDNFLKDLDNDTDSIYGIIGEKYDLINLKTFKVKNNVEINGHGGGSYYFYDSNKDVIWFQEYDTPGTYTGEEKEIEKYNKIGTKYALCIGQNQGKSSDNKLYGYFDIENGKIVIKPEYEKASLFQYGIAAVKKDGKAYYISENNVRKEDESFEEANGMHEFRSWIKKDGKWKLVYFKTFEEKYDIIESNKEEKDTKTKDNKVENGIDNTISNTVENTVKNNTLNNVTNNTTEDNIIN